MAITSFSTPGTAGNGTASTSLTLTLAATINKSNDRCTIFALASDNISTSDGATNDHTSASGGAGTWTKLFEHTNSNGSAGAGVTVSAWLFEPNAANAIGTNLTFNFSGSITDKACTGRTFTTSPGNSLRLDPGVTPIPSDSDGSSNYTSQTLSGLSSKNRLYARFLGKEANSATALTASANFSAMTTARSRNNAAAIKVDGEFRINTSTGETSAPTLAVSGDTAEIFLALEEYTPSSFVTHDTTGVLTGDIGSVAGSAAHVAIHGTSGALTGQLGSLLGSAAHIAVHGTSGGLTGQLGSVSGSAARKRVMSASGVLTGQLGSVSGSASRFRAFSTSGALPGQAAVVSGSAARRRDFGSSGALAGQGASIVGAADRSATTTTHATSGALSGQGATVSGSAARSRVHAVTGVLTGQGSAIVGSAQRAGELVNLGSRTFSNLYFGSRPQSEFYLGLRTFSNG